MDAYNFISKEDEEKRFFLDEDETCKKANRMDIIIDKINLFMKEKPNDPMVVAKPNLLDKPFREVAISHPNFPDPWLTVSFKEFGLLAKAYAYVLKTKYNIQPQDRIGILANSLPRNHLLIFALWFLRAVAIVISPKIGDDIRQCWIKLLDIKMCFYDSTFKPYYEEYNQKNESEWTWNWLYPLGEDEQDLSAGKEGILLVNMDSDELNDAIVEAKANEHFFELKGEVNDMLNILGTSSSTQAIVKNGQCSTIKFVPATNIKLRTIYYRYVTPNVPNRSIYLILSPFYHGLGINVALLHPQITGGPVVYRTQKPDDLGIIPEMLLDDFTETNIQESIIFPFYYAEWKKLKEENHPKWPIWEKMIRSRPKGCFRSGGAPPIPEVFKWFKKELNVNIVNGYGSTEAGLVLYSDGSDSTPGEEGYIKKIPWVDVYIDPINPKDPNYGELYARTANLLTGYFQKGEKGKIYKNSPIPGFRVDGRYDEMFREFDGKPFFKTGDIFRRNPITNHYKHISRADDIITFSTGVKLNPIHFEFSVLESCKNIKVVALLLDNTKTEVICFVEPEWENILLEDGNHVTSPKKTNLQTLSEEDINNLSRLAQKQVWDSIHAILYEDSGSLSDWAKQLTINNIVIVKYGDKFPMTDKGSSSKRVARIKYSEILNNITKVIKGDINIEDIYVTEKHSEIKNSSVSNENVITQKITEEKKNIEEIKITKEKKTIDENKNIKKNNSTENKKIELNNSTKIENIDQSANSTVEIRKIEIPSNSTQNNRKVQEMIVLLHDTLKEFNISIPEFDEFDSEKSFKYFGIDSLTIIKFAKAISTKLNKHYYPSVIFNYGTPRLLAEYLVTDASNKEETIPASLNSNNSFKRDISKYTSIAIIGMGLRLPGSIDSEKALWSALVKGKDCVSTLPKNRNLHEGYVNKPTDELAENEHNIPKCGYYDTRSSVAKPTQFDATFFNCAPEEAIGLDPKHRWILETSWEALENAGIAPSSLENSSTGVFVGIGDGQELAQLMKEQGIKKSIASHNSGPSAIAGRLSYFYKLFGPSISIDTACSTGATALHTACRSMMFGECDLSIVSAARFMYFSEGMASTSHARMTSPNGRCATFDAAADGFAPSEGCVTFILKRLEDAERDQDNILGVILGTSSGQSGFRQSISAPSSEGQARNIQKVLDIANIKASQVSYVEAHGTGTPLGDALEAHGLNQVFGKSHSKENPLIVGSVKSNMGHTCEVAGLTGIAKVLVSMKNKTIPRNIHFNKLNPEIDLDSIPMKVPVHNIPWKVSNENEPRIAEVSSYGLQGSVMNMLIQEYIPSQKPNSQNNVTDKSEIKEDNLLVISAKDKSALITLCGKYLNLLDNMEDNENVSDLCYSTQVTRQHFEYKIIATGKTVSELSENLQNQLDDFIENEDEKTNEESTTVQNKINKRKAFKTIAMVCSESSNEKLSDQYFKEVSYLFHTQPVFKDALDECDIIITEVSDYKILLVNLILCIGEAKDNEIVQACKKQINENSYISQMIELSVHYATKKLLNYLGISPNIFIGHQFGEIYSAVLSERVSLKHAFALIQHLDEWKKMKMENISNLETLLRLWMDKPELSTTGLLEMVASSSNINLNGSTSKHENNGKIFYSCNTQKLYLENEEIPIEYWVSFIKQMLQSENENTTNTFKTGCQKILEKYNNEIVTFINISINNNESKCLNACIKNINNNESEIIPQYCLYENGNFVSNLNKYVGEFYLKGIEIQWNNYNNRSSYETERKVKYNKVNLPLYPFQRSTYWPKIEAK